MDDIHILESLIDTLPAGSIQREAICRTIELARRVEEAPRGEIQSVNFEDVRPVWAVMDDRDAVPLNEPKRVALVPLG